MHPFKFMRYFALAGIVLMSFSCEKEKDEPENENPPTDRGNIEVDGYWFIFEDVSSQVKDTFKYGKFGTDTLKYDTIRLDRFVNSSIEKQYAAEIQFFDSQQNVTEQIKDKGFNYIVCYRGADTDYIRLENRNRDANGYILGLESEWYTKGGANQNVMGSVRVTLNYQTNKENLCDGGVRIFDVTVPYKLY